MSCFIIKPLYVVFLLLALIACENNNSYEYEQAIKTSYGRVINFSWNKQFIQEDTVFFESNLLLTPIKVVSYIDQMLCDPCFSKYLYGASVFMARFPSDSVKYICVVSRSEERLKECVDGLNSNTCVVIRDIDDSFVSLNSLERHSPFCRTFLLDANNRVLLTRDPLRQANLQKLYIEKINELIYKGGVTDGEQLSDIKPIVTSKTKINIGTIHIGDTATFDFKLHNKNKRPVCVEVKSECDDGITITPMILTVAPKSRAKVSCTFATCFEGPIVKHIHIQNYNSNESQTITITGMAVIGI